MATNDPRVYGPVTTEEQRKAKPPVLENFLEKMDTGVQPTHGPVVPLTLEQKAKIAFEYLAELKTELFALTHEQMDLAVSLPMKFLPPNDVETLLDVARQNGVPLWQALYAQFRRANEQGNVYALVLDVGWLQIETVRLAERSCPECRNSFMPKTDGQIFCNDVCGAAKDRRAFEERRRKAEEVDPPVAPSVPPAGVLEGFGPFVDAQSPEKEAPGFVPIGVESLASQLRSRV